MRIGDAEEFKRVAEANLESFHKLHEEKGVNTIVTSCAGCYRAIKKDYILAKDYDKILDGIRVVHTVDLLNDLFQGRQIQIQRRIAHEGHIP